MIVIFAQPPDARSIAVSRAAGVAPLSRVRVCSAPDPSHGGPTSVSAARAERYLPTSSRSTESPVFSTRRGFGTGLKATLCVRSESLGR